MITMRRCKDCKIILEDDVNYCPKCGKDITTGAGSPNKLDVGALLTSANLHRIRAEWVEAIADATEALRLEPRNPDIASLLAGIYEEQGKLEDAEIWYQMALELNPNSAADKARLERITALLAEKRKGASTDSFRAFEKHTKLWAGVLGGVFLVLILFATAVFLIKKQSSNTLNARIKKPDQPGIHQPYTGRIPSAPGSRVTSTETPAASQSAGSSSLRTPGEAYIRSEIANADNVHQAAASVDDVIADPRSSVTYVTFSIPARGGILTKDEVLKAALAVASKTFEINSNVKWVTARCLVSLNGPQGTQIVFIGDVARQSVASLPANATTAQITAIFASPWWSSQVR